MIGGDAAVRSSSREPGGLLSIRPAVAVGTNASR
jgi:hypothetical protein